MNDITPEKKESKGIKGDKNQQILPNTGIRIELVGRIYLLLIILLIISQ